ncbi:fimbrial protein [Klebsiella aerogenes]|uniref:fimbrial protein n=1 Tax=Klebsiella aerogenes TaxID=548 RepID=UPI002E326A6C|nr:fimbrial protein [Klebsiella aerogenes]MED7793083.1 fimbrial protein [Klebsiella aerogenes]
MKVQSLTLAFMFAGLLPVLAMADNTAQINLSGTLIEPPPCTINNGETIAVNFGDNVGTHRVDGINYKQKINYSITCKEDPLNNPWVMGLTVVATPSQIGEAVMQAHIDGSSSTDLGIKMILDGSDFTLNERKEINLGSLPVLEAVPIQMPGATLPEGHFSATATLLADYE